MCKKLMFLISFVLVLVLGSSVSAATFEWDGLSDYSVLWFDPLNWDPNGGPSATTRALLEPGFPGDSPVVLVDNAVGKIFGPRHEENGDMTLEIVSGYFNVLGEWLVASDSNVGVSTINIGLGAGYGDPCVYVDDDVKILCPEPNCDPYPGTIQIAGGEVYLNIGGNSYVCFNNGLESQNTDDDECENGDEIEIESVLEESYFEWNIFDTALVVVNDDVETAKEDSVAAITVSGSATLDIADGGFQLADNGFCSLSVIEDGNLFVDNGIKCADDDSGSWAVLFTDNAYVEVNGDDLETGEGEGVMDINGNAIVVIDRRLTTNTDEGLLGTINISGNAQVLINKDGDVSIRIADDDGQGVMNMFDCPGPHVVTNGDLTMPATGEDSAWATLNLHGGLLEVGGNLVHDSDNWNIDICPCGVMVVSGDIVDQIMADYEDGKITVCGYYQGCGAQGSLRADYNHPDFPGKRTKIWVEEDPNMAYDPDPMCCADPCAESVPPELCLSWTAGDNAESHAIFLSTNIDKLTTPGDLSALIDIVDDPCTEYCVEELCLSMTYYWRVDEIYPCGTSIGQVWCFTVVSCLDVDDFEAYDSGCGPTAIYEVWKDGAGDCNGIGGNGTGSSVYVSTDPAHTGDQSMEYQYDSTASERENGYSEATIAVDLNFEDNCEDMLALWFYGDPDNDDEQMWFVLSDGTNEEKVVYGSYPGESSTDIQVAEWQGWYMDVQDFADGGVDLSSVSSMSIGFGPRGAEDGSPPEGIVFFDDIIICEHLCIEKHTKATDLNRDCVVDWEDLEIMLEDWLENLN